MSFSSQFSDIFNSIQLLLVFSCGTSLESLKSQPAVRQGTREVPQLHIWQASMMPDDDTLSWWQPEIQGWNHYWQHWQTKFILIQTDLWISSQLSWVCFVSPSVNSISHIHFQNFQIHFRPSVPKCGTGSEMYQIFVNATVACTATSISFWVWCLSGPPFEDKHEVLHKTGWKVKLFGQDRKKSLMSLGDEVLHLRCVSAEDEIAQIWEFHKL